MRTVFRELSPVFVMLAINIAIAVVIVLIKKIMDQGTDSLVIVTYRQLASAVLLTPIAFLLERKNSAKLNARILCYLFFSALIGVTLTQYLTLLGLQYTSATISCAFFNIIPVITFLMALPFGLESLKIKSKSGLAKILSTIVCIGGATVMTFYKGVAVNSPPHSKHAPSPGVSRTTGEADHKWVLGLIFLFAGATTWSSWYLTMAFINKAYPDKRYTSTAIMSVFGALQSAILCLIVSRDLSKWALKGALEISTILYAGMIVSGLCVVGMSWCVNLKGPAFTAAFTPSMQMFVAIIGVSLSIEQIHIGSILGSVLLVAGVYLLLWGKTMDCSMKQVQPSAAVHEDQSRLPVVSRDILSAT